MFLVGCSPARRRGVRPFPRRRRPWGDLSGAALGRPGRRARANVAPGPMFFVAAASVYARYAGEYADASGCRPSQRHSLLLAIARRAKRRAPLQAPPRHCAFFRGRSASTRGGGAAPRGARGRKPHRQGIHSRRRWARASPATPARARARVPRDGRGGGECRGALRRARASPRQRRPRQASPRARIQPPTPHGTPAATLPARCGPFAGTAGTAAPSCQKNVCSTAARAGAAPPRNASRRTAPTTPAPGPSAPLWSPTRPARSPSPKRPSPQNPASRAPEPPSAAR